MKGIGPLLMVSALIIAFTGCDETSEVDAIIHNAVIYSVDDLFATHEAMAIQDGKIVEIGPENAILNRYRSENKIDLNKQWIVPGFIDAHSHFLGYGLSLQHVNLIGTKSFKDVLDKMKNHHEEIGGDWIQGRGWDQNDWDETAFPDNTSFDSLFSGIHIAIKRVDGHAVLVSNSVLELAGITKNTQVDGGKIVLNEDGNPTGLLIDEAMSLIDAILPQVEDATKKEALLRAQEACFQVGLTTVCDAGLEPSEIQLINDLHNETSLLIRVYAMYSAAANILDGSQEIGIKTDRLTAKAIKVYADGAMGSRGARLLEPYSDDPASQGFMITPKDSILKWANFCYDNNLQLAVHCIGSAGSQNTLDAMSTVLNGTNDRRWRIEHAQMIYPNDRSKFKDNNIIPSMQPTHATSDMYWVEERVGPSRIGWTYSTKSLMEQNGLIALGTDFPVEGIEPIRTFYAAVSRRDGDGYPESGFLPDQKLDRIQALKGMTIWAAIASFEEEEKGSLEAGKVADFIVLNKDILNCNESEILETDIIQTWVNGAVVYEK